MPTMPSRQPTAEALEAAREWMHSIPNPLGPRDIDLLLDRWDLQARAEAAEECGNACEALPASCDAYSHTECDACGHECEQISARYRAQLDELEGGE